MTLKIIPSGLLAHLVVQNQIARAFRTVSSPIQGQLPFYLLSIRMAQWRRRRKI